MTDLAHGRFAATALPEPPRSTSAPGRRRARDAAVQPGRAAADLPRGARPSHPEVVGAAHREYLEAGAELIETLSFGANRQRLAAWGLETRAGAINRRAVQLARDAREVSGRDALVGGSVGPVGSPTRGASVVESVARDTFREQIEGLLEGGADLIVLETFSDLGPDAARPRTRSGAPPMSRSSPR